ncbi:hypothetical protein COV18_00635 [Candidatus Woesearchaeota archaeon CG10_big_fil_rev_8_21_14_0_10_37_12]|nr:MAG: hypothetical protein COV18_00635 [Candidatus Woesearchaeota archaeon CG10_big_fil_rev_8_21_14_0_10_37_12]
MILTWFIIGETFDVVGKILIGIAVLLVHKRVMKEHKIDVVVLKEMHHEQVLAFIGIFLIIVGYIFHIM